MSKSGSRPNPFDFSNPVTDRSVLAGRATEMEGASYYLDQSRDGPSYSLALVGERASGKTSLLNALGDYAAETGLLAAHIRLDQDLAGDELEFFREVFVSLMESCARRGLFGGEAGAEYDTFRNQVLHSDLETDRDQEPLAFGRVYATDRGSGTTRLSRRMLLSDIEVIVERCAAAEMPAVVLLIDEGDGLAANHGLLQTLRNLLMDSSHFVLIIAGTEQMFPAISEVFSPVPRQFVRINVGPFRAWRDTRNAIQTRLVLAGREWATPSVDECEEIHSLTRGSPYEVMLVSHFAYREMTQRHQRLPMSITPSVIESVADQLAQQNPAFAETVAGVQALVEADGETLRELIELDDTPVDRFAVAKMDFSEPYSDEAFELARGEVVEILERLAGTGFLSIVDGRVRVKADQSQRALIKYIALGQRAGEEDGESLLIDPVREIGKKTLDALGSALGEGLDELGVKGFAGEVHPVGFRFNFAMALDQESAADDYAVHATCSIGPEGDRAVTFVFRQEVDSDEFRERLGEILLEEAGRLKEFGVLISEIRIGSVDRSGPDGLRVGISKPDSLEAMVEKAMEAFYAGTSDFPGLVEQACGALLDTDPDEDAEHALELNNCAFMALGTDDSDGYLALGDRAEALEATPLLTGMTRALWEALQGRYDASLGRLDLVAAKEAKVDPGDELLMYSPAVLASEEPTVGYDDLVGQVRMADVLRGYRAAIEARRDGRSVAAALDLEDAPPWLWGAAADAAEVEGKSEYAIELRRRAAQKVGRGDGAADGE
jgi:hypothetical protein